MTLIQRPYSTRVRLPVAVSKGDGRYLLFPFVMDPHGNDAIVPFLGRNRTLGGYQFDGRPFTAFWIPSCFLIDIIVAERNARPPRRHFFCTKKL